MALKFREFYRGIILKAITSDPGDNIPGSLWHNSTSNRIKSYVQGAIHTLVSEDQTQTLSNKSIDGDTNTLSDIAITSLKTEAGDANKFLSRDGTGAVVDTVAVPTGAVVGESDAQTLTNKTIDGDDNTLVDIALSSIKTILADANRFLVRDGTGAAVSNTKLVPTGDVVGTSDSQVLTNKSIDGDDNTISDVALASIKTVLADANKFLVRDGSGIVVSNTKDVPTGAIVGTSDIQTISNKTLDNTNIVTTLDTNFTLQDNLDNSKQVRFQLTGISTGTTRTLTVPNIDAEIIVASGSQNLDTKTLTNATIGVTNVITVREDNFAVVDNVDSTKIFRLQSNGTTGTATALIAAQTAGRSITLPDASTTLVGTDTTQTLSNKTLDAPTTDVINWDQQSGTPASPAAGFNKTYFKDDGKFYKLDENGIEIEIGSGSGSGGINYIENSDFETDAAGYVTYADAAGTQPVDGTGGAPVVTFARSTSLPLRGDANGLLTKDAANRQGEGVSYDLVVDRADNLFPQMQRISFDYEASANFDFGSGTAADPSDIVVYVYDVDGAQLIQPSVFTLDGGGHFSSEFQPNFGNNDYRLIFHVATTNALAWTFKIDNVQLGPVERTHGAPVTDWQNFTPTGTWVANTTYTGKWRRVGDSMQGQVYVLIGGGSPTGDFTVNLPSGYTIDTTKVPVATDGRDSLGIANAGDVGVGSHVGVVTYASTTSVSVFGDDAAGRWTATNPFTFGDTDFVAIEFQVPILGWSSSVEMSSNTDTRVIALVASQNSGTHTATGTWQQLTSLNVVNDTHNGFNTSTDEYTIQVPGYYSIDGQIIFAVNNTGDMGARIRKNGGDTGIGSVVRAASLTGTAPVFAGVLFLNAGDVITLEGYQATGGNLAYATVSDITSRLSIRRVSGPATIAASELILERRTHASGQSIPQGITTPVDFEVSSDSTHGGYVSGVTYTPGTGTWATNPKWVAPSSGRYSLTSTLTVAVVNGIASLFFIEVYKNNVSYCRGNRYDGTPALVGVNAVSVSTTIQLNAGDYIDIRIHQNNGAARLLEAGSLSNHFSIHRIS